MYTIYTGTAYLNISQSDLVRMLGEDGATNLLNGWTVKGCWRVW